MSTEDERDAQRRQREQFRAVVAERLGRTEKDPMIDLREVAILADVSPNTPPQWRQRARTARETRGVRRPFPAPDNPEHPDKPLWRAVSTICPWLDETRRWPPGSTARPEARVERG